VLFGTCRVDPPTIYFTFDDGPNPTTTPELLDVLAREQVRATFFLIANVSDETAPIVRRMFAEGHAVALHSATRRLMLLSGPAFARRLGEWADRIETVTGSRPCRAFRPHAGWRSIGMYAAMRQADYRLVGWSWMLWDWNWFPPAHGGQRRCQDRSARGFAFGTVCENDDTACEPRRARAPIYHTNGTRRKRTLRM